MIEGERRTALQTTLAVDGERLRLLTLVRTLPLPDCWVGAGFVRDAVWDDLHGFPATLPSGDVDVVWFDPANVDPSEDRRLEERLLALDASVRWSVKNQARMHVRNGDAPYASTVDAIRHWPETATAVAARLGADGSCELAAPFGLDDLFHLVVRPTPVFSGDRCGIVLDRLRRKRWLERWPRLRVEC